MCLISELAKSRLIGRLTSKQLYITIIIGLTWLPLQSQVLVRVRVNSGNCTTTCTDGFLGGAPEPTWSVNVNSQGYVNYPQQGICYNNPPYIQYSQSYNCPSTYPTTINICFRAFEDDGAACVASTSCLVQTCQNFAVPAPGNSQTYTLSVTGASNGTVNFTILTSGSFLTSTGTDNRTVCVPFTWIDGNIYSSNNNTATYTIPGGAFNGCDSIVTLNATFYSVSDITTSLSGATIAANNSNATYAWLDCNNSFSIIAGETSQSFTPVIAGSYAVKLTENGCLDTSNCVSIIPLPVAMLDQLVTCKNEQVYFDFTTTSEVNNSHFIVERSADAVVWELLQIVEGSGNSNSLRHYQVIDSRPHSGINYYRLSQVDYSGEITQYEPKVAEHCIYNSEFFIYPNPALEFFNVYGFELAYNTIVNIYDLAGRCMKTEKLVSANQPIHSPFNPGTYLVEVISATGVHRSKLLIE